jgi:DNA-binding transcriptional LysR family regulator
MTITHHVDTVSSKTDSIDPPLDLNGLARFAAVVECGGFSAAARALGLPRQVLHRSVAALEATAGVQLLERSGGRVRPTDAGQRLSLHAAAILSEARAAHANVVAARDRPRGRLRLTAPHLFAEEFLARPIQDFLAAWPDVEVDVDLTVAHRELMRDDLDLAIRLGPRPTEAGYVTSLGSMAQTCCAAPSYIARVGALAEPSDLERHSVIFYGRAQARLQWRFERDDEKVEVPIKPRLRVGSARIALSACRTGLGVAGLPRFMCAQDLSSGALVHVLPEWQMPSAGVWALSTIPITRSVTLRAFVDLIRARMAG